MKCLVCKEAKAALKRPKTNSLSCVKCFLQCFEDEIYQTIKENNLFTEGETICIGISGGKDSTVLAHVINKLNNAHNLKLDIQLVAIDEGIHGYRDDSLETVKENAKLLNLPLTLISYKELFNWTMDEIVALTGLSNSCTYCGVFRRQALDLGAIRVKATKLVTGHNADDLAETVLMNLLRGDFNRLPKSVECITGGTVPRVKPFKYIYEKEIVMYAHYMKLKYFCTECTYAVSAYRGNVRELIKELEVDRSSSIIDIIHSAENWKIADNVKQREKITCTVCGKVSSNKICKGCALLKKLDDIKSKKENKSKTKIKYEENKVDS